MSTEAKLYRLEMFEVKCGTLISIVKSIYSPKSSYTQESWILCSTKTFVFIPILFCLPTIYYSPSSCVSGIIETVVLILF